MEMNETHNPNITIRRELLLEARRQGRLTGAKAIIRKREAEGDHMEIVNAYLAGYLGR